MSRIASGVLADAGSFVPLCWYFRFMGIADAPEQNACCESSTRARLADSHV